MRNHVFLQACFFVCCEVVLWLEISLKSSIALLRGARQEPISSIKSMVSVSVAMVLMDQAK